MINNCCIVKSHLRLSNPTDIVFNNEKTIILNQNDPNPFSEHTTITYNIPSTVSEAKIIFFDNSQRILQSINILERGPGQITVYAEKLSTGTYLYSLIADGIVVETKKMVCSK
jgi:hypothetical protein